MHFGWFLTSVLTRCWCGTLCTRKNLVLSFLFSRQFCANTWNVWKPTPTFLAEQLGSSLISCKWWWRSTLHPLVTPCQGNITVFFLLPMIRSLSFCSVYPKIRHPGISAPLITDTFFWYCHSYGTTCSAMKWRITIANANTANPKSLTLLQSLLQLQTLFCRGTSFFVASLLQRL